MLVKHNNNSISDITSVNLPQGKMTLISSQTASASASIEFTSGIDSTYPIYRFEFINIHPATNLAELRFQGSTNGGSSYGLTITSTKFEAYHNEADTATSLGYNTGVDLAQSTSFQTIIDATGNNNDDSGSGYLYLFSPSSTVYVKHFMARNNHSYPAFSIDDYIAGYFNTTSAINAIKFQMSSGNIDSGTIKLYGIKGD
jgi:hypothetical protein